MKTNRKWEEKSHKELRLYHKNWRNNHRQQCRDAVKRCRQKKYPELRLKVFTHYGGNPPKCVCCGETITQFLSIDHINNDGAKQRKRENIHTTTQFYTWLKKNNYPEGYQVLCMNCNCGKARNHGICPHKMSMVKLGKHL